MTFRVWAPNATNVAVRGAFNGWGNTPMVSEGNGNWSVDVNGATAGQEYKYRVNATDKRDPRSRRVVNSVGNSIIYNPNSFDWGTTPKPAPFRNDLVIYQMHIGTFEGGTPPRTFDQGIARLDHVKNLGINAIKLMPINEFAGDFSWGYNPSDPFAIESRYGSADGLKRFIKACHERGIAVFMDVVHNHYGPSDLDLWRFDGWFQNNNGGIYFYNDSRASTDWGPRPDFGRPEVRSYIRDQIMMFVQEYRVGGFRWDSVYNILYANGVYNNDGFTLLRDINWELSQNYPEVVRGSEDHAYDQPMNFEFVWDVGWRWNVHGQLTASADANRNMSTVKSFYDGWPTLGRVLFTEAHDYIATMNGNRTRIPSEIDSANPESIWARKRALLGGAIVMTAPGMPMIFQGQEMHETQAFHDNVPLRWTRTNTHAGIVRAYRDLIHIRRNQYGGMNGLKGTGVSVPHVDNVNKVVGFVRWNAGGQVDDVVGVINFSGTLFTNNTYQIPFPSAGTWYRHFNSDSTNYASDFGNIGAAQVEATGSPPQATINMGMYSMQLFSKTPAGSFTSVNPIVTFDPPSPTGCVSVAITYNAGTGSLMDAPQVFIHLGRNGWQNVIEPNPAMTSLGSNRWRYIHMIPANTYELNMVFNNGAGVWDNNNQQDWAVAVVNCVSGPNTNPVEIAFATAEQTVVSNVVSDLITIQLLDENDQVAVSTNAAAITLRNSLAGSFRDAANSVTITNVVIGIGQSSASFRYLSTQLGQHFLTASNNGLITATQRLTVVVAPAVFDLHIFGNGNIITDGSATPVASNHTAFGEVYVGTNFTRTFVVTNTGTSALGLGPVQVGGMHLSDFSVMNPLPASLAQGQTTNFSVRFTPAASGTRSATISFTNSASAKSPYDFAIIGVGAIPVISLSSTSLTATTTLGNSPAALTLSVSNSGTGLLAYTATVNVAWLTLAPSSGSLAAGAGLTHTAIFNTVSMSAGVYNGTITIAGAYASNSPRAIAVSLAIQPPPPATQLVFTNPPRAMVAGQISDLITVALADAGGALTISDGPRTVQLSSDRLGVFLRATGTSSVTSVTISNGASSANFRYSSSAVGIHLLTATDGASILPNASQVLTVNSSVSDVFTNSVSFVVPQGVTQLVVEAWGGGGGARQTGNTTRRQGGGGGAYARSTLTVAPGMVFNVVVGQGGAAGSPAANGGDSSFGNTGGTNVLAKGGGGAPDNNTVGAGGSATLSVSTDGVRYAGGAGGTRSTSTTGGGGGGGGSAFTNAAGSVGGAGGTTTGGTGGAGAGTGGNGGASNNPGQTGFAPGGGGGGAGNGSSVSGAGARGMVRVSYVVVKSGAATFDPEFPQGCVPLLVIYEDDNGVLAGAQEVNMLIGHNNWMYSQVIPMVRVDDHTWSAIYPIPEGTLQMEFAFNNGSGTWDNNSNNNWPVYVTDCNLSEPYHLAITNPPSDLFVGYGEDSISLRGTASRMAGDLNWQNMKTGESGTIPAESQWQIGTVELDVGQNLFVVSGMTSTENPNHGARDSASNVVYSSAWVSGQNGGQGWGGGWNLSANGSATQFIARTTVLTGLTVSTHAWTMQASSGGFAEARRPFAERLHNGDILTFKFQNKFIDSGSSVGFSLKNHFNQDLLEFYFIGGSSNYIVRDAAGPRDTGIFWTPNGFSMSFELLTPTTYRLVANSQTFTGELIPGTELMARHFRAWNFNAGSTSNHNVYIADLAIVGAPLESSPLTAQRTINRRYGPTFYVTQPISMNTLDLIFPLTDIGYLYHVHASTNLMETNWWLIGQSHYGNGQPLEMPITNQEERLYLRTSVRPVE